jgi:HEAT repeat protein
MSRIPTAPGAGGDATASGSSAELVAAFAATLERDPDYRLRREAAHRLGFAGPAAVAALTRGLDDPVEEVQEMVIRSLDRVDGSIHPPLLAAPRFIHSNHAGVRVAALRALGRRDAFGAIGIFIAALDDLDWRIRTSPRRSSATCCGGSTRPEFRGSGYKILRVLALLDRILFRECLDCFARHPEAASSSSLDNLDIQSARVRLGFATALASSPRGEPRALAPLLRLCDDADAAVRRIATGALARFPNQDVFRMLLERLQDREREVGEAAIAVFSAIGGERTDLLLDHMEHSRNKSFLRNALVILRNLKNRRALPRVLPYLGNTHFHIREAARRPCSPAGDMDLIPSCRDDRPQPLRHRPLLAEPAPGNRRASAFGRSTPGSCATPARRAQGHRSSPTTHPCGRTGAQEDRSATAARRFGRHPRRPRTRGRSPLVGCLDAEYLKSGSGGALLGPSPETVAALGRLVSRTPSRSDQTAEALRYGRARRARPARRGAGDPPAGSAWRSVVARARADPAMCWGWLPRARRGPSYAAQELRHRLGTSGAAVPGMLEEIFSSTATAPTPARRVWSTRYEEPGEPGPVARSRADARPRRAPRQTAGRRSSRTGSSA